MSNHISYCDHSLKGLRTCFPVAYRMEPSDQPLAEKSPALAQPLPELTLKNLLGDLRDGIGALVYMPFCSRIVAPIVVTFTSIASKVVISRIPYTEIDFSTYMQQIELVNLGEIDYSQISGDTGPIVYPAGFVQIYQALYSLSNGGEDVRLVQNLFGYLLVATNLLVLVAYMTSVDIQPWPLYLLLASKRLMSIYVLRLFNDCFTTFCMVAVTLLLQQAASWSGVSALVSFALTLAAADMFSIAISIKMNALLYLPAFLIVSFFAVGQSVVKLLAVVAVVPLVQVLMGWKFLLPLFADEDARRIRAAYLSNAFNFSRQFLFKWTVNWKFVGHRRFESPAFSHLLLAAHISLLLWFVFTRYLHPKVTGVSVMELVKGAFGVKQGPPRAPNRITSPESSAHLVLMIMATTNVIGVLCARSLHYQFLSWYCWQLPYLIYMTNWGLLCGVGLWAMHEWSWNVYPATPLSSSVLVAVLLAVLIGVWRNKECWFGVAPQPSPSLEKKNQ